jgi:hypothetical protein
LQVNEELPEPVLDSCISPGQEYYIHGQSTQACQSTQAQADDTSISHGIVSATKLDAQCHIRGDGVTGRGDSGAGCFSVATGALVGMIVGRDEQGQKAVIVPTTAICAALTRVRRQVHG